jgi:hypothetical protein
VEDTLNILGIFSFLFSVILLFYILRKKNGPLVICGWLGLFVYSIPSFINRSRKLIYAADEEYHLVVPDIESKFIYFLFWLGFGFSLFFKNFNIKKENYLNHKIDNSLNIFIHLSFFYLFITIIFFFFERDGFIVLIGRWLFLFVTIGLILQKKKYLIFFVAILAIIYSLLVPDRTLVVILLSFIFANFISKNFSKKKNIKEISKFYLISFIIITVIISSVIFNKYVQEFRTNSDVFIELMLLAITDLHRTFEPLLIYAHTLFAINDFKDFSTIKYLISIFSNLTLYPSFFGLSSDYYNISIMEHLPHYTFGIAGSIMASTYLAFGYLGLFITGYIYGLLLKIGDFNLKFQNKSSTIFLTTILLVMSIYIHRNGLDNFLAFVRQIFLLFIFIKLQELFISFVKKNN